MNVNDEGPQSDGALMLRVREGDGDAFTALVRRHQDRVVSLATRYLADASEAEDLAQEVFLRVHRARETYEPSAKFTTWLHRITVNACLNQLRGRKARGAVSGRLPEDPEGDGPAEPEDPNSADPGDAVLRGELASVVRRAVDELPERQRTAILLEKYQGLSYEETAAAMEMSLPAVKSLLTRARVSLREKLEPYLSP